MGKEARNQNIMLTQIPAEMLKQATIPLVFSQPLAFVEGGFKVYRNHIIKDSVAAFRIIPKEFEIAHEIIHGFKATNRPVHPFMNPFGRRAFAKRC